jgi:hypothetical protein
MTLGMLIAYDEQGNIVAGRDFQVVYDEDTGEPLGMIDFLAAEAAGIPNTEFWNLQTFDYEIVNGKEVAVLRDPQPVRGSKAWPEWLGGRAVEFRVVLAGPPDNKRIVKLVHKKSGHERERAVIEAAIADRIAEAQRDNRPADIRDLVGGPDRPLFLDKDGKTGKKPKVTRPNLPIVRTSHGAAGT